jgi:translocation and assembly module TamB
MKLFPIKPVWLKLKALSRLKKILLSIFLSFSILVALLSCLMATQLGSHWVVRTLANMANVQLGTLQGNLITGLDVASVDFKQDEFSLHADKLSFRWQPLGLFYSAVAVQSLSAENLKISLPPRKNEPDPENYPWPSLAQPVRIKLQRINLHNINIYQGDTHIPITALQGNLSLGTFHLRTSDLTLTHPQASLQLNGSMGLRYPYDVNVDSQWTFNNGGKPADKYVGNLKLTGDIKTLKLQNQLSQPLQLATTATISPALRQPKVQPKAEVKLEWAEQALLPEWVDALKLNQIAETAIGKNSVKGVVAKGATTKDATTKGTITASGWLNTFKVNSQIQLKGINKSFYLTGDAQGQYDLQKKSLHTKINTVTLSDKSLDVKNQGENTIHLTGDLIGDFKSAKKWRWNINLNTEHFNLNHFIADWPSDIQLALNAQGSFESVPVNSETSGLKLAFSNIDGRGELRGLSVSARGDLSYDGASWNSSDANLAIGANQLMLKGQAGNDLALEWKINAPLLGQIDPSISGSIISSGLISGDKKNPRIKITAQVERLLWRDYAVENVSLNLKPQTATADYDFLLAAKHVQWKAQSFSHIDIKGAGTLAQHKLEGKMDSPTLGTASLTLDSSWKDEIWRGQWREFIFGLKKVPRWTLASASPMHIDARQINTRGDKLNMDLGRLCLTTARSRFVQKASALNANNLPHSDLKNTLASALAGGENQLSAIEVQDYPEVCMTSRWNNSQGFQLDGTVKALPIDQFQAWFKPEVILKGVLDGNINLRALPAKSPVLDAQLQARDAQFLYQFQGGDIKIYPLQSGKLNANLKNDQFSSALLLDWAQYGTINATGKYNLKDKKIQGKLGAALNDLAPLESLLPFLNKVVGSASADLNFSGSASKPEVVGNIKVIKGGANLPKLGLVLRDFDLQVNSQSSGNLHLDGQVTSGEGTLMVKGDLENFGTPQWAWQSNIYGANIRFVEQPQLIATLSPNLKLSANANAINLTGSTEIPWARAIVKTLPASATRVSADVTVIENEHMVQNDFVGKKSIPLFTNIILYFGDDVRFKGFGLDTQLLGKVNVLKEENRQTFVTGFVAVGKGNYKAYGQDLVIERGRLIFQGPYDNPGLDIRAVRVMNDGSAGLEIGGTLQHPKSTVFAVPSRSDSEAMAMLLTGKPLSQSSQADAYSLIGAIGSLGMDRGQSMTSDIASMFRIDEIAIKSDKGFEQSELWMGKYVTPKLFIRYMVGLFDQAFALGVRYEINDKLRLEAESGKTQSVDVIYKIER